MMTVTVSKESVTYPQFYKPSPRSILDRFLASLAEASKSDEVGWGWTRDIQLPENQLFQSFYKKLRSFPKLNKGWDSYDAEAPNLLAVAKARVIIKKLEELQFVPTNVCPSVEGGTSIYFIKGNKYADFEFFNSGEILAGMSNRVDEPVVWKVSRDNIENSIERIRQFLND